MISGYENSVLGQEANEFSSVVARLFASLVPTASQRRFFDLLSQELESVTAINSSQLAKIVGESVFSLDLELNLDDVIRFGSADGEGTAVLRTLTASGTEVARFIFPKVSRYPYLHVAYSGESLGEINSEYLSASVEALNHITKLFHQMALTSAKGADLVRFVFAIKNLRYLNQVMGLIWSQGSVGQKARQSIDAFVANSIAAFKKKYPEKKMLLRVLESKD